MPKILEPLPYFKWFWRDWRANRKVQRLNYIARGLYRDLLDEQWENGSLPPDVEALADICGCPVDVMQHHWESLQGFFEEQEDGSLANAKLEKQRTEEDATRAARAKSGRQGAIAKINKTKDRLANAKHLPEVAEICHIAEQSRAIAEQSITEQGEELEMKIQTEARAVCEGFGVPSGGYKSDWEDMAILARQYKVGAVINDLKDFLEEYRGDDFPKGAIPKYLQVASDRLSSDTAPAAVALKDPTTVSLARELSWLSGGVVAFLDKQKIRLAEVLKEFTAEEVTTSFKEWLADQDLSDPKNVSFLPGKFVQIVDSLAYSARRRKQEADQQSKDREAAALRLQREAEESRLLREQEKQKELDLFDPLA